jgi:acylphosphatase
LITTKHLRIYGLVQGVFFRESMRQQAAQLKITGWVRNRSDGTVEAIVQGNAQAIERIIDWARCGPPAARVDGVDVEPLLDDPDYTGFEKKPTA